MEKFEKLVLEIMAEAEKDGEPVTRAEAEQMAKMEIGAKGVKHEAKATKPKAPRKPKERKVDEIKKMLLDRIAEVLADEVKITGRKTETEIGFTYKGECYTLKLTKHRNKK